MATNIGPKIGVEGAAEYRKQISTIIAQAKELDSEMKMVTSSFNKETTAEEKNAKKKEVLSKQIKNQQERVALLKKQVDESTKAYGENDARTIKLRTSLNNATTVLNKMGQEMDDLEKETKQSTAQLTTFDKAVAAGVSKLPAMGNAAKQVAAAVGKTLVAAATAATTAILAGATAMVKWSKEAGAYADEILTLSQTTRLSTETLQELAYMAELVDVDLSTVSGALSRNVRSMRSARNGTKETAEAYERLGVKVVDANGEFRDSEEVFWDLIDALGRMENETERDALAQTILGRSASELNPLINAGSKGMKEYAREAHEVGAVLSGQTLKSLGKLDDNLQRLKQSGNAAKRALGAVIAPTLTKAAGEAATALGKFSKAVDEAQGDSARLDKAFTDLVSDMSDIVIKNLPEIIEIGSNMISSIAKSFRDNPDKIQEAARTLISNLIQALSENAYGMTYNTVNLVGAIVEELTEPENLKLMMDAAIDLILGLVDGLAENADTIAMAIPNILAAFRDELKDAEKRTEIMESARNFLIAFGKACAESANVLIEIMPELVAAIAEVLTDPEVLSTLALAGADASVAFAQGLVAGIIENLPTILEGSVSTMGFIIKNKVKQGAEKPAEEAGKDLADGVARGMGKGEDAVDQKSGEVADKAMGKISPLEGEMETSGQDMMEGIKRGIGDRMQGVINKVRDMANQVRALIHFSRPDEGPLHDYEKWMPDFMKGLAKGIDTNKWRVEDAVAGLSSDLALNVNPMADPSAAARYNSTTNVGGITVQVYGTEGQSVDALADRVMDKINITLQNSGKVWA